MNQQLLMKKIIDIEYDEITNRRHGKKQQKKAHLFIQSQAFKAKMIEQDPISSKKNQYFHCIEQRYIQSAFQYAILHSKHTRLIISKSNTSLQVILYLFPIFQKQEHYPTYIQDRQPPVGLSNQQSPR